MLNPWLNNLNRIDAELTMRLIWMFSHHRIFMIKSRFVVFMLFILFVGGLSAQRHDPVLYSKDDDGRVFTSLEEALNSTTPVYRLKLTKLVSRDSLPEDIFRLSELRELTVKGCRLCVLNQNISKFTHLKYLNLDKNKLLRLPNSLCELKDLTVLVVSRNILEALPDSIGNMCSLQMIDAWDNPLYFLPESISKLQNTLNVIDLRQIPIAKFELEAMEKLLPKTKILYTDICECENRREHN